MKIQTNQPWLYIDTQPATDEWSNAHPDPLADILALGDVTESYTSGEQLPTKREHDILEQYHNAPHETEEENDERLIVWLQAHMLEQRRTHLDICRRNNDR